jgi:hypothetical protein
MSKPGSSNGGKQPKGGRAGRAPGRRRGMNKPFTKKIDVAGRGKGQPLPPQKPYIDPTDDGDHFRDA